MSMSLLSFFGLAIAVPRRANADSVADLTAPVLPAIDHPALLLPLGDRPLPEAPLMVVDRAPISHHVRVRRTARRRAAGYSRRAEARM